MNRKEYSLGKRNKKRIRIIDARSKNGFSFYDIDVDAYISLLESGGRKLEYSSGVLMYRKGLGVRKNKLSVFLAAHLMLKNVNTNYRHASFSMRRSLHKKREQA